MFKNQPFPSTFIPSFKSYTPSCIKNMVIFGVRHKKYGKRKSSKLVDVVPQARQGTLLKNQYLSRDILSAN